jgi:hypothetical protein
MFSSFISKRFGKRFCSSVPKQNSCSTCTKKIGFGFGLLGITCFALVLKRDRNIAEYLHLDPKTLGDMLFPTEKDCLTAMSASNYRKERIKDVPWYHRSAVLVQYPSLLTDFKPNQYGILDAERKLMSMDVTHVHFFHDEHLEEFAKVIPADQFSEIMTHNLKLIRHSALTDIERFDFLKARVQESHREIVRCPEEYLDDLLATLPKELFCEPMNFENLILSGRLFRKYFGQFKVYKVTNEPEFHRGLQLKSGLVVDHQPFDKKEQCSYGIHFSRFPEEYLGLYDCDSGLGLYGFDSGHGICHLREVEPLDNSIIRIGHNSFKADQLFLGPPLTNNYTKDFPYKKTNDEQSKIRKPPTF